MTPGGMTPHAYARASNNQSDAQRVIRDQLAINNPLSQARGGEEEYDFMDDGSRAIVSNNPAGMSEVRLDRVFLFCFLFSVFCFFFL
jgi:hypothetical protein